MNANSLYGLDNTWQYSNKSSPSKRSKGNSKERGSNINEPKGKYGDQPYNDHVDPLVGLKITLEFGQHVVILILIGIVIILLVIGVGVSLDHVS